MRSMILAALAVISLSFSAMAGPREDALAVLQRWSEAFAASDVDAITALYAPDALFMGTGSKTVVTEPSEIRRYFEAALLSRQPRSAPIRSQHVMVLSDEVVLVTALNDSVATVNGQPVVSPGRVTFVFVKRGGDWRIVHFHRSSMPQ